MTPEEALAAVEKHSQALPEAIALRDAAIRMAFAAGAGGTEIAKAAHLARSRVYKIRDEGK